MLAEASFRPEDWETAQRLELKQVPGYPRYWLHFGEEPVVYSTTSSWNSSRPGKLRALKPRWASRKSVLQVALSQNNSPKEFNLGHLVYITAVGPMPEGTTIDHIDNNPANNCPSNLRPATYAQQGLNKGPQKGGTSQYRGVSWCNTNKHWRAVLHVPQGPGELGKYLHLGSFDTEKEAALAYDSACREKLSADDLSFAYLNFPNVTHSGVFAT